MFFCPFPFMSPVLFYLIASIILASIYMFRIYLCISPNEQNWFNIIVQYWMWKILDLNSVILKKMGLFNDINTNRLTESSKKTFNVNFLFFNANHVCIKNYIDKKCGTTTSSPAIFPSSIRLYAWMFSSIPDRRKYNIYELFL